MMPALFITGLTTIFSQKSRVTTVIAQAAQILYQPKIYFPLLYEEQMDMRNQEDQPEQYSIWAKAINIS